MKKLLAFVALTALACGKTPPPAAQATAPTAPPQIVYVVVTPTAAAPPDYRATVLAVPAAATPVPPAPTVRQYLVPPANAAPPVERAYCVIEDFVTRPPDSIGNLWFDGDVRNVGSQPVKVKILVKAYSINEVLLDSKMTYPQPSDLGPDGRGHFRSYVHASGSLSIFRVVPEVVLAE